MTDESEENKHLHTRGFPASLLGDPRDWVKVLPDPEWTLPPGWMYWVEGDAYVYLRSRIVARKVVDEYVEKYCQGLPTILDLYFRPINDEIAKQDESLQVRN